MQCSAFSNSNKTLQKARLFCGPCCVHLFVYNLRYFPSHDILGCLSLFSRSRTSWTNQDDPFAHSRRSFSYHSNDSDDNSWCWRVTCHFVSSYIDNIQTKEEINCCQSSNGSSRHSTRTFAK